MSVRLYYRIEPTSPIMPLIQVVLDRLKVYYQELRDVKKEYGALEVYDGLLGFVGLSFPDGLVPPGWRAERGESFCVPRLNTKEGKEIKKRLERIPVGQDPITFAYALSDLVGAQFVAWCDNAVRWTTWERYGETFILNVPVEAEGRPGPDCIELKMSEYHAIREAHHASLAPKAA